MGWCLGAAARLEAIVNCHERNGAQGRNRTTDTVIFSHVLYQLSYLGAGPRRRAWVKRRAL
jgi:hypothetical protein